MQPAWTQELRRRALARIFPVHPFVRLGLHALLPFAYVASPISRPDRRTIVLLCTRYCAAPPRTRGCELFYPAPYSGPGCRPSNYFLPVAPTTRSYCSWPLLLLLLLPRFIPFSPVDHWYGYILPLIYRRLAINTWLTALACFYPSQLGRLCRDARSAAFSMHRIYTVYTLEKI